MRFAHDGKPFRAVCGAAAKAYHVGMITIFPATRLSLALRVVAAIVLLSSLALWSATGAHRGWTRTSTVVFQRDEITGIDFPVRQKAFVAGIEIPALGAGAAILLLTAGAFAGRRRSTNDA